MALINVTNYTEKKESNEIQRQNYNFDTNAARNLKSFENDNFDQNINYALFIDNYTITNQAVLVQQKLGDNSLWKTDIEEEEFAFKTDHKIDKFKNFKLRTTWQTDLLKDKIELEKDYIKNFTVDGWPQNKTRNSESYIIYDKKSSILGTI